MYGRGWNTVEDNGLNSTYYLYENDVWYRSLSPYSMGSDGHAIVNHIHYVGSVGNGLVNRTDGGVHLKVSL